MIDKVLSVLRGIQSNTGTEFKVWFTFSVDMAKSVGVEPNLPSTASVGAAIVTTFYCNSSNE